MTNAQWFLLIGALLLAMGLSPSLIKRLPVTSAIVYLAVGVIAGPTVLGAFHFNPLKESALLETLTEVAVLISLFAAGLKMPVPFSFSRWRAPMLLAFVSMSLTVGLVAMFAHYALALPLGAAVLLGAIVAPTDPVLATDVQIRHQEDRDRLRFSLTSEAGMNDGSAFPFVMLGLGLLGLHDLGEFGLDWMLVDVLWATSAGIMTGIVMGFALTRLTWWLRKNPSSPELWTDFLGLGLLSAVYGISELISAWGFLAVFAAAVSLRQTEHKLANEPSNGAMTQSVPAASGDNHLDAAVMTVSKGSLSFKEHLERLSELVLILLVGGTLFVDSWSWKAVSVAAFLFLVARPLSVLAALSFSRTPWRIRLLAGWFGVRGIGSLYYLMYAIQHGISEDLALELIHITLVVVTLSILVHGISVKPLMNRFSREKTSTGVNT
ncbi:MAG TPA: sodium:proton antiporter [Xanthomonadales bacterium]|nr:sodium:proton antiporter [Xanthomonadales bacterium]